MLFRSSSSQELPSASVLEPLSYRQYLTFTVLPFFVSCEELVLEKVYPDGNYETELVDFYLVNADTMQVTDEQKNTW